MFDESSSFFFDVSSLTMNAASSMLRPLLSRQTARISRAGCRRGVHIEKKIEGLGIELPAAPLPKANYNIICVPPGENVMYVSGHLPIKVSWRSLLSIRILMPISCVI